MWLARGPRVQSAFRSGLLYKAPPWPLGTAAFPPWVFLPWHQAAVVTQQMYIQCCSIPGTVSDAQKLISFFASCWEADMVDRCKSASRETRHITS